MRANVPISVLLITASLLSACGQKTPPASAPDAASHPPPAAANMKAVAGVQDIMAYMVDPAADFLWESVATVYKVTGTEERQPRTDEEWREVHKQALLLTEGANLLLVERHVAREGKDLEDHGTAGNLSAAESDKAIREDRQSFIAFALALRDVGETMVAATDKRDVQALFDAGDQLDQVCESCHLKFWYPGQVIPPLPENIPEAK